MKDKINNIKNIDVNDIKNKLSVKLDNFSTFKNINKLNNEKKFFGFIIIILVFVILVQGLLNYNLITANRTNTVGRIPPPVTRSLISSLKTA